MHRTLLSALISVFLLVSPVLANYHGFSAEDYAEFEVLPGWRTSDGTHMVALKITLKPGWKTYWRAPGDAGIPPRFDWRKSKNLKAVRFHWPTPVVFEQGGMRSVGYMNQLILPIELTPRKKGAPIALRAEVELGVCEDICIPVQVRISADLNSAGGSDTQIKAAMGQRPDTAREAGMRSIACNVEPIADGIRLTARIDMPSLGRNEIAIVELPDQSIWVSEARTQRQGRSLTAVADIVPPKGKPFMLDRSELRFTVLGAGRGVDILGCRGS